MEKTSELRAKEQQMLDRILKTADKTRQLAKEGNCELHGQGTKTDKLYDKLRRINQTNQKNQKTSKETEETESYWTSFKNKINKMCGVNQEPPETSNGGGSLDDKGHSGKQSQEQKQMAFNQMEELMRDEKGNMMLDEIMGKLNETKAHCKAMNEELHRQNHQFGDTQSNTDQETGKIVKVNKLLDNALKQSQKKDDQ